MPAGRRIISESGGKEWWVLGYEQDHPQECLSRHLEMLQLCGQNSASFPCMLTVGTSGTSVPGSLSEDPWEMNWDLKRRIPCLLKIVQCLMVQVFSWGTSAVSGPSPSENPSFLKPSARGALTILTVRVPQERNLQFDSHEASLNYGPILAFGWGETRLSSAPSLC